jgi:hypothetical protein
VRVGLQILVEPHARRGHEHRFLGPALAEGGVAAPLHVGLLHDDERLWIEAAGGEQLPGEVDVLSRVGRPVLDQNRSLRHAACERNAGELIRLGLGPDAPRDAPLSAGEDEEGSKAVEKELRAPFGDAEVVAAENENDVGGRQLVPELVITPESLDVRADARVQAPRAN